MLMSLSNTNFVDCIAQSTAFCHLISLVGLPQPLCLAGDVFADIP